MIHTIEYLKKYGFTGFKPVEDLWVNSSIIPKQKGVYVVLNSNNYEFLNTGVGGFFKGINPNVGITTLENKWVDDAIVIYIGKAGGTGLSATLYNRIIQYLNFGKGKAVGHRGGRYIWQLKQHARLVIAWKELPNEEPIIVERQLINSFVDYHGQLPFANLV